MLISGYHQLSRGKRQQPSCNFIEVTFIFRFWNAHEKEVELYIRCVTYVIKVFRIFEYRFLIKCIVYLVIAPPHSIKKRSYIDIFITHQSSYTQKQYTSDKYKWISVSLDRSNIIMNTIILLVISKCDYCNTFILVTNRSLLIFQKF